MDFTKLIDSIMNGNSFAIYGTIKNDSATDKALQLMPNGDVAKKYALGIHLYELRVNIDVQRNEIYGYADTFLDDRNQLFEFICSIDELTNHKDDFLSMIFKGYDKVITKLEDMFKDHTNKLNLSDETKSHMKFDINTMVDEHIWVQNLDNEFESASQNDFDNDGEYTLTEVDHVSSQFGSADPSDKISVKKIENFAVSITNGIMNILDHGAYACKIQFKAKDPVGNEISILSLLEATIMFNGVLIMGQVSYFENGLNLIYEPELKWADDNRYNDILHEHVKKATFGVLNTLNKISSGTITAEAVMYVYNSKEVGYV